MTFKNILDNTIRIIVGGLFIFSGLIKLNDPRGTQIKMEEYFEVFAVDFGGFFEFFVPYALLVAMFVVVLEVVLGVAVLLNYKMNTTAWILLVLIVFFTFLTGYSAIFNKVTDCGCFGDAIPLTPWQSFYKDLILIVLIAHLFWYRKRYKPVLKGRPGHFTVVMMTLLCIYIGIYAIRHLPYIDFRPYEIGKNIPAQMEPTKELKYAQTYTYVNVKTGEEESFEKWDNKYSDESLYKYKGYEQKLLNPEDEAKITDYNVTDADGKDVTGLSFQGARMLIVMYDAAKADKESMKSINAMLLGLKKEINPMVLTASGVAVIEAFRHEHQLAVPYYFTDGTVLKAMVRSNPGLVLLNNGTVLGKWHFNDAPSAAEVNALIAGQ